MYVRWKTLIVLGVLFWFGLCVFDTYFSDVLKSHKTFDSTWFLEVPSEVSHVETVSELQENEIKLIKEGFYFHINALIIWNIVIIGLTATLCTRGRSAVNYYFLLREKIMNYRQTAIVQEGAASPENPISFRKSASKIPIPIGSRSSTNLAGLNSKYVSAQNSCTSFRSGSVISLDSTAKSFTMKNELPFLTNDNSPNNQHNARLRDEIFILQERSMKDNFSFTRKIEALNIEKQGLGKQLSIAIKEGRSAQKQLEDMAEERNMLIKRLEHATREFKSNTQAKRMTLAQLEVTQETIANLRQDLQKVSQEKEEIKSKYNAIKKEVTDQQQSHIERRTLRKKSKSPTKDIFEGTQKEIHQISAPMEHSELHNISKSQKEVEKVQERIQNLEKSLCRLTFLNYDKKVQEQDSENIIAITDMYPNIVPEVDTKTILSNQNTEISDSAKPKLGNLTDEQRLKPSDGMDFSRNEEFPCFAKQCQLENPFERVGSLIKSPKIYERAAINYKLNINYANQLNSSISETEKSMSPIEDDDSDESENGNTEKRRIVSNSPAFQSFLKKMEPIDKNPVGKIHHILI